MYFRVCQIIDIYKNKIIYKLQSAVTETCSSYTRAKKEYVVEGEEEERVKETGEKKKKTWRKEGKKQ